MTRTLAVRLCAKYFGLIIVHLVLREPFSEPIAQLVVPDRSHQRGSGCAAVVLDSLCLACPAALLLRPCGAPAQKEIAHIENHALRKVTLVSVLIGCPG